jgi:hypothetical protein
VIEGTIGLIVNPSAGRDSRRLVGSAVVSDNYAKRWAGVSVLEGLTGVAEPVEALVMPDETGIARRILDNAPEEVAVRTLDIPVQGNRGDTRRAAARLRELADVVVVLGGDGTVRDVTMEAGDLPIAGISTGTNNVVPTYIDGTAAGLGAAVLATGGVDPDEVTYRHGTVRGVIEEPHGKREVMGLGTAGVIDQEFTGTRAILHSADFVGGVVSRAEAQDSGLSGMIGTLETKRPDDPGGIGARFGPPEETERAVRAIPVPGVVDRIGIEEYRDLADGEEMEFEIDRGVVSFDGERDVEVQDARIRLWPSTDGPRLVDFDALFEKATAAGCFDA